LKKHLPEKFYYHFDRGWKPFPHIRHQSVGAASSREKSIVR
jgi:hypothetical protein